MLTNLTKFICVRLFKAFEFTACSQAESSIESNGL